MASELTLLTPGTGPIELTIDWQPAMPAIAPHAAAYIAELWAVYLAQSRAAGGSLFNGAITQMLGVQCQGTAGGTHLTLQLAPGEYRDFLVTRLRDRAWFERHAPECRVMALGNSALVTRGNQALLGRRSPRVSCYADRFHMIGGVLEALDTAAFPANRAGIEAHLLLELREEIGLVPGEERRDGWPRVLGLAEDHVLGQPELFWQWEVNVDLETLVQRVDPAEHSAAVVLRRDQMTDELWAQLTPVARQAWRLWTHGR